MKAIRASPFLPLEQIVLPYQLRRLRARVYHSPHLTVPYASRVPVVLTVHDAFPLREPQNARSWLAASYYRTMFPAAVRRASIVVVDSRYGHEEIREVLNVPETKLRIVEPGVETEQWRPSDEESTRSTLEELGVRQPYLLYVGTAKRHKNLVTLLKVMRSAEDLPPLVLAGPTTEEITSSAPGLFLGDRLKPLGRVPEGMLASLYSGAQALALPSLYEAVGFTALEAMACGTPVVSSSGGGLPETIGDAGLVVPPNDVEGWIEALRRVLSDQSLRLRLINSGHRRVSTRSWARAAAAYLEIYREAAERVSST